MATFTVTTTADSGPGSLRQAILDANGGGADAIVFDLPPGSTIVLADDLPWIDGDVTIDGSAVPGLTISGAGLYRVFWAENGDAEISELTIANGLAQGGRGGSGVGGGGGAGLGGGLFVNTAADVTLRGVTFSGNGAVGGEGGAFGPGVYGGGGGGGMGEPGGDSVDSAGGIGGGSAGGAAGVGDGEAGGPGGDFSGGGGGGESETSHGGEGGDGGFGGGGGGAAYGVAFALDGGEGGFGGGGGGSTFDLVAGGGGYGGGAGGQFSGGGGAGLGGAVFVRDGGSLVLEDVTFASGNTVLGGESSGAAGDGSAEGANLFLMGGGLVTYGVTAGQTVTLGAGFESEAPMQLTKTGAGVLVLTDPGDIGDLLMGDGVLRVTANMAAAGVTVMNGATLQGTGAVGAVDVHGGGTLAPGASPGVLTSGDLNLNAGATFEAELAGTGAGQFDRVNVTGTVNLGGATLDIVAFGGFTPAAGNSFLLIDNDGSDAVVGAFAGFAQGTPVVIGGLNYTVSYTGGTGNDVTLTITAIPPPPPSPPREIPTLGGEDGDLALLSSGHNAYAGGGGADLILGLGGKDVLQGNMGADSLDGGAGDDVVYGGRDDDLVDGGADDDWLYGDLGNDQVLGGSGNDVIQGGAGNDLCEGDEGADIVRGGQGADTIQGGDGNDWLSGDLGDDLLTGGLGADTFHIFAGAGIDRVTDFSVSDGDRVQLLPGATFTLSQVDADTVVDLGTARLVLQNVQLSSLPEGWIFGA